MAQDNILLKGFAIQGYRSFGDKLQYFDRFSKIKLFIGQNNSGKSNILRFINTIFPNILGSNAFQFEKLDAHIPGNPQFSFGLSISLKKDAEGKYSDFFEEVSTKLTEDNLFIALTGAIFTAYQKKAQLDNTDDAWFLFNQDKSLKFDKWEDSFSEISDKLLMQIWNNLTRQKGGDRAIHWLPESLKQLAPSFPQFGSALIPAIRQVGVKGSTSDGFSVEGLIERLARLQNPSVLEQDDRTKFESINEFLQNVTDNVTARIEIPNERDTINIHMDGKVLPLESLGTGIHEVIILASASTILDKTVVCMEEPELHLNPTLQKKLVRYLQNNTTNQYFISTHSAALMDTPKAEVYHVNLNKEQSIVSRVTTNKHRSSVCENLGYHPSDLLQSNCVIWVEGPSDRLYLRYWINELAPKFIEGIHYSIMFYGGRLASHISGNEVDEEIEDFISLRRMNRKGVIVIDSDREKKGGRVNDTKRRLKTEFDGGTGFAWITQGREIENYLPEVDVAEAINQVHPKAKATSKFKMYENTLIIKTEKGGKAQASKVKIAKYITENKKPNFSVLDLKKQVQGLVEFISDANPGLHLGKNV